MDEYLTLEEIESRYAPDWVLIVEPRTDELQQLLGGRVVERSSSRSELYRKAKELGLHHIAVVKLGPVRTDLVYMLSPTFSSSPTPIDSLPPPTVDDHGKERPMNEYLTIEEIEARYAPDWVLIAEPNTDESQHLLGGRVVGRAGNHVDLLHKARELDLHHIALRKLGPWPANMELVL